MAFKAVILCVSALLVQSISGRCISAPPSCGCSGTVSGVSFGNIGCNSGITEVQTVSVSAPAVVVGSGTSYVSGPALASSGGDFVTTSVGSVAPSGIGVDCANELYGELLVSGALPYLTAIAFEGAFANDGVASVAYGCGDGEIAITEVIGGSNGVVSVPSYSSSVLSGPSYGNAVLAGPSCGSAVFPAPSCGCSRYYSV